MTTPLLKSPNVNILINKLSDKFNLEETEIYSSYLELFPQWEQYVSPEEFLSLTVFAIQITEEGLFKGYVERVLGNIAKTLNDEDKLRQLKVGGISGILDIEENTSAARKELAVRTFDSEESVDFLIALSEDQKSPNSIFIQALEFLAQIPIE